MLTCPSPSKRRSHAAQRYQWRIPVAEVYPLLIIVFLSNLIIHHLHLDLILKENEPLWLTINMQDIDLNHVAMRRHDICQKYTDFQAKSCILKVRDLRHCSLTTCDRSVCSALLQGDGEILSVNDAILYSYKMKRTTVLRCFCGFEFPWPFYVKYFRWSDVKQGIELIGSNQAVCYRQGPVSDFKVAEQEQNQIESLAKILLPNLVEWGITGKVMPCNMQFRRVDLESQDPPVKGYDQNPFLAAFTRCKDAAPGCFQNMLKPEDAFFILDLESCSMYGYLVLVQTLLDQ